MTLPTWLIDKLEREAREEREQRQAYEQLQLPVYQDPLPDRRDEPPEPTSRVIIIEI
jgi:hypothetical protein